MVVLKNSICEIELRNTFIEHVVGNECIMATMTAQVITTIKFKINNCGE